MGLFKQRVQEPGFWMEDFKNRFDERYFNADGYPTSRVRWRGRELRDPLAPGFVFASLNEQLSRAKATLAGSIRQLDLPLNEAERYFQTKVAAALHIFRPNLPLEVRKEFEAMLTVGLALTCQDYLNDSFPAHATYRKEFERIRESGNAALIIAWFWAIDPVFRLPNFIDEFILVGTQLTLRNMGELRVEAPVTHPY